MKKLLVFLIVFLSFCYISFADSPSYMCASQGLVNSLFANSNLSLTGNLIVSGNVNAGSFCLPSGICISDWQEVNSTVGLASYWSTSNFTQASINKWNNGNSTTDIINSINKTTYVFAFGIPYSAIINKPLIINGTNGVNGTNSFINGTGIRIDITTFNATINDGTNDSLAFKNFFTNYSTGNTYLYIPCGTYNLGEQITLVSTVKNLTIEGQGQCTKLVMMAGVNQHNIFINGADDITIKNLLIDGNLVNAYGLTKAGIATGYYSNDIRVEGVYIQNTGLGILINNGDSPTIINNEFNNIGNATTATNTYGMAISIDSTPNTIITGNKIKTYYGDGGIFLNDNIGAKEMRNWIISNNNIKDGKSDQSSGIHVYSGWYGTISGNDINSGNYTIDSDSSFQGLNGIFVKNLIPSQEGFMTITNNNINVSGNGIEVNAGFVTVSGNKIYHNINGTDAQGIFIGGNGINIIGNNLNHISQHGIYIGSYNNTNIIGNTIDGCGLGNVGAGIRLVQSLNTERYTVVGNSISNCNSYAIFRTGVGSINMSTVEMSSNNFYNNSLVGTFGLYGYMSMIDVAGNIRQCSINGSVWGCSYANGTTTTTSSTTSSSSVNSTSISIINAYFNSTDANGFCPNRPLISTADRNITVPTDFASLQDALCEVPYILRHYYSIDIYNNYTLQENVTLSTVLGGAGYSHDGLLRIRGTPGHRPKVGSIYLGGFTGQTNPIIERLNITSYSPYYGSSGDDSCGICIFGAQQADIGNVWFQNLGTTRVFGILLYGGATAKISTIDFLNGAQYAIGVKQGSNAWIRDGGISGTVTQRPYYASIGNIYYNSGNVTGSGSQSLNLMNQGIIQKTASSTAGDPQSMYGIDYLPDLNALDLTADSNNTWETSIKGFRQVFNSTTNVYTMKSINASYQETNKITISNGNGNITLWDNTFVNGNISASSFNGNWNGSSLYSTTTVAYSNSTNTFVPIWYNVANVSQLSSYVLTTQLGNATIIRSENTSWLKTNQNYWNRTNINASAYSTTGGMYTFENSTCYQTIKAETIISQGPAC